MEDIQPTTSIPSLCPLSTTYLPYAFTSVCIIKLSFCMMWHGTFWAFCAAIPCTHSWCVIPLPTDSAPVSYGRLSNFPRRYVLQFQIRKMLAILFTIDGTNRETTGKTGRGVLCLSVDLCVSL